MGVCGCRWTGRGVLIGDRNKASERREALVLHNFPLLVVKSNPPPFCCQHYVLQRLQMHNSVCWLHDLMTVVMGALSSQSSMFRLEFVAQVFGLGKKAGRAQGLSENHLWGEDQQKNKLQWHISLRDGSTHCKILEHSKPISTSAGWETRKEKSSINPIKHRTKCCSHWDKTIEEYWTQSTR